jgi:hypothetical protein
MAQYLLIAFLLLYALVAFGLGIPLWAVGLVAGIAGVLLLVGK